MKLDKRRRRAVGEDRCPLHRTCSDIMKPKLACELRGVTLITLIYLQTEDG